MSWSASLRASQAIGCWDWYPLIWFAGKLVWNKNQLENINQIHLRAWELELVPCRLNCWWNPTRLWQAKHWCMMMHGYASPTSLATSKKSSNKASQPLTGPKPSENGWPSPKRQAAPEQEERSIEEETKPWHRMASPWNDHPRSQHHHWPPVRQVPRKWGSHG